MTGEIEQAATRDTASYEVVGSLSDPDAEVPSWIDNVIQVNLKL